MKAYKFKNENEKDLFKAFICEQESNIDMFDFNKCVGVRFTLHGDLHLLNSVDYRDIELVDSLEDFVLLCN